MVKGVQSRSSESEMFLETPSPSENLLLSIGADENGMVIVSRFLKCIGGERLSFQNFGPLWLPPVLFVPDAKINLGFLYSNAKMEKKGVWNGRPVYCIVIDEKERETRGTIYYHATTGILVGAEIEDPLFNNDGISQKTVLELSGYNISGL
jgi:hypothetical protein